MPMNMSKAPGWDWAVDYVCEDGEADTMLVFGQMLIEDALAEARASLSFNFFRLDTFAPPQIVAVRRA